MLARLIAIAVLLLVNGFFVAAEFALVRSRRTRLESMARTGDWKARLALRASGNLAACLLGEPVRSYARKPRRWARSPRARWAARSRASSPRCRSSIEVSFRVGIGAAIALTIVTYLHVVFGELAPRGVALAHPEDVARWLTPPLLAFAWLMYAVHEPAQLGRRRSCCAPSGQRATRENVHSAEELRMLVEQSEEGGALQTQDADLLEGVFEFSEKNARDVMTPRTDDRRAADRRVARRNARADRRRASGRAIRYTRRRSTTSSASCWRRT